MGFDEGRIILDSDNGVYYAGQTVFGRIVFTQDKPKTIHGIYVSCKGFCKVHWTTTKRRRVNNRTQTRIIHHESYEEYFKKKYFVIGNSDGEHHLQTGPYEYNFDCLIPNNCPSSFEGEYGHIRYQVKVVMVTSGIFSMNKEKKAAVRVHTPLDLNANPQCKDPIEYELNNTYCCCCVTAGFSEVHVKLPVGGYCPGQVIPIQVSVVNHSSVEIDELKFSIKQDIKFEATTNPGIRYDHKTVATITKGPIQARTTRNWQVDMEVPVMEVYNLHGCRYIDINNYFKVSTETSGCHEDSEESHPIIIGTIPLAVTEDMVHIPLHDQMPMPLQSGQIANSYPPPPIINQPLPHSPYLNSEYQKITNIGLEGEASSTPPNFNNGSPYLSSGSPYPSSGSPYPGQKSPQSVTKQYEFHGFTNAPCPAGHMLQPRPGALSSYSGSSRTSSPAQTLTKLPYPIDVAVSPYPNNKTVPPYPTSDAISAYPINSNISPYPTSDAISPYPASNSLPPYPTNDTVTANSVRNSLSPYPTGNTISPLPINNSVQPHQTSDAVSPQPKIDVVSSYPTGKPVPPYPTSESVQSDSTTNSIPPYPTSDPVPPYPTNNSVPPYPKSDPVPPYSAYNTPSPYSKSGSVPTSSITSGLLKTGTIGFAVPIFGDNSKLPATPPTSNIPYPTTPAVNPYASATAPEQSPQDNEKSQP